MDDKTIEAFNKLLRRVPEPEASLIRQRALSNEKSAFLDALLLNLSDWQLAVVDNICRTEGADITEVIAAAGSGKTFSLVGAVARALREGNYRPEDIFSSTFTKKAASEMEERLARAAFAASGVRLGTFHRLAGRYMQTRARTAPGTQPPHRWNYKKNVEMGDDSPGDTSWFWGRITGKPWKKKNMPRGIKPWDLKDHEKFEEVPGLPNFYGMWPETEEEAKKRRLPADPPNPKNYTGALELITSKGLVYGEPEAMRRARAYEAGIDPDGGKEADGTPLPSDFGTLYFFVRAWELYEKAKRSLGLFDFADLLTAYWKDGTDSARLIIVDEAQDNSEVQLNIAQMLRKNGDGRMFLIGDVRQCVHVDTLVGVATGQIRAGDLRVGSPVFSLRNGEVVAQPVARVVPSTWDRGVEVKTAGGHTLVMSPHHKLWATLPAFANQNIVYLMYRHDMGFRIGITNCAPSAHKFGQRPVAEGAEKLWVIKVCADREEALLWEETYSLQYQIPTALYHSFHRRETIPENLRAIFARFGKNGIRLLQELDLRIEFPHWVAGNKRGPVSPGSPADSRCLTVNLCAHTPKGTQVGLQWVDGSGDEAKIAAAGLTGAERHDRAHAKFIRRYFLNYRDALAFAEETAEAVGGQLRETMNVCGEALPMITASGLFPGMAVPTQGPNGLELDRIVSVQKVEGGQYIDLDVPDASNFFGNGVLTSNSIYQWRGANPDFMIEAPEKLGADMLQLPMNYRSGRLIVELGNAVATKKWWSIGMDAKSFRSEAGYDGEVIIAPAAASLMKEADAVAKDIRKKLDGGMRPEQVAILVRTNAPGANYEVACLKNKVPCLRLGSKHGMFDRKIIKAAMSYAKLSSGDDLDALRAVANTPKRFLSPDKLVTAVQQIGGPIPAALGRIVQNKGSLNGQRVFYDRQLAGVRSLMKSIEELRSLPWRELDDEGNAKVGDDAADVPKLIAKILTGKNTGEDDEEEEGEEKAKVVGSPTDDDDAELVHYFVEIVRGFESYVEVEAFTKRLASEVKGVESTDSMTAEEMAAFERDKKERVVISTIHRSKGLEWDVVYLSCTKGLFPHFRSTGAKRLAEEERLFYVAVTRAADTLIVTYAKADAQGRPAGPSSYVIDYVLPLIRQEHTRQHLAALCKGLAADGWQFSEGPPAPGERPSLVITSPDGRMQIDLQVGIPLPSLSDEETIELDEPVTSEDNIEVLINIRQEGEAAPQWRTVWHREGADLNLGQVLADVRNTHREVRFVYGDALDGLPARAYSEGETLMLTKGPYSPTNQQVKVLSYGAGPLYRVTVKPTASEWSPEMTVPQVSLERGDVVDLDFAEFLDFLGGLPEIVPGITGPFLAGMLVENKALLMPVFRQIMAEGGEPVPPPEPPPEVGAPAIVSPTAAMEAPVDQPPEIGSVEAVNAEASDVGEVPLGKVLPEGAQVQEVRPGDWRVYMNGAAVTGDDGRKKWGTREAALEAVLNVLPIATDGTWTVGQSDTREPWQLTMDEFGRIPRIVRIVWGSKDYTERSAEIELVKARASAKKEGQQIEWGILPNPEGRFTIEGDHTLDWPDKRRLHQEAVHAAAKAGKHIPAVVLDDYDDLLWNDGGKLTPTEAAAEFVAGTHPAIEEVPEPTPEPEKKTKRKKKAGETPPTTLREMLEGLKREYKFRPDSAVYFAGEKAVLWQGEPEQIGSSYRIPFYWTGTEEPRAPLVYEGYPGYPDLGKFTPTHSEVWTWTGPAPGTWTLVQPLAEVETGSPTPEPSPGAWGTLTVGTPIREGEANEILGEPSYRYAVNDEVGPVATVGFNYTHNREKPQYTFSLNEIRWRKLTPGIPAFPEPFSAEAYLGHDGGPYPTLGGALTEVEHRVTGLKAWRAAQVPTAPVEPPKPRKPSAAEKRQAEWQVKLDKLLAEMVTRLGGVATPGAMYSYRIPTALGALDLSAHATAIMARFDDVGRAAALLNAGGLDRVNPHTGKWNHHAHDDWESVESLIPMIESDISRINRKVAEQAPRFVIVFDDTELFRYGIQDKRTGRIVERVQDQETAEEWIRSFKDDATELPEAPSEKRTAEPALPTGPVWRDPPVANPTAQAEWLLPDGKVLWVQISGDNETTSVRHGTVSSTFTSYREAIEAVEALYGVTAPAPRMIERTPTMTEDAIGYWDLPGKFRVGLLKNGRAAKLMFATDIGLSYEAVASTEAGLRELDRRFGIRLPVADEAPQNASGKPSGKGRKRA